MMKKVLKTQPLHENGKINTIVSSILAIGMYITFGLYFVGIIIFFVQGGSIPKTSLQYFHNWHQLIKGIYYLTPEPFFYLGTIVLILTPVSYIAAAIFVFLWERNYRFVVVTIIIASVIALSILIGSVFPMRL